MPDTIKFGFHNVLSAIPSAVIVTDKNKTIIEVNNFTRRIYRGVDLVGKTCDEVFTCCEKRGNGCPVESLDYMLPSNVIKLRQKIKINDYDENVTCRIIPAQVEGNGSEYIFLHVVMDRDLIAREKLIELEKNLTITTLTSGIAHEFNNMNAGIYGLVELVLSHDNISKETAQDMSTILKIVKRASHLIDQLLIFSNRKPSKRVLVNLETIVDNCIKILRPEMTLNGITIEFLKKGGIDDMFIDANKISLAIMNIMINARDAMIESVDKKIFIETGREDGFGYVKISDTGTGIPPEFADRIFEPFYTTKGSLGSSAIPGTGLGLSVAAGVLKEHGGSIEVESDYGNGSTFILKLPENADSIIEKEVQDNYHEYDFTGKRILVVDDEIELNSLLTRALTSKNAEAVSVYTGAQALDAVDRDHVDVMLLDIQMPEINGWDVVERLKYLKNRPKIIIISGNFLVMDASESKYVDKVLIKPFDLDELFLAVKEVLE